MKKSIFILLAAIAFVATSCKKEEIGGTAVQAAAGEWQVVMYIADENDQITTDFTDPDIILTYNVNDNSADKMYIDDLGNLYEFKVPVSLDLQNLTFEANEVTSEFVSDEGEPYDIAVTVKNGKILKNAAKTPSGMPADSIRFSVFFEDQDDLVAYYAANYGVDLVGDYDFDHFVVAGFRYTGFAADEP